jgi:hypothetical protein
VTRHIRRVAFVVLMALSAASVVWAQGQADKEAAAAKEAAAKEAQQRDADAIRRGAERSRLTPLSVEVVVTRYQGEKKVSSLPYTLAVNANDNALAPGGVCQLRMGTQVPVPGTMVTKDGAAVPSVSYRDVGTNIDCSARSQEDGSFQLRLTVEDTSVLANVQDAPTPKVDQTPVFRSFRSVNTLVLRDGQTRDFSAAADRVSGEVVRIAVTLRVVK